MAKKLKYQKGFPTAVPMLSEANRSKRILWAKKNKRTRWQHAIFADEAVFWLSRGRVKIWTKGNKNDFILQQNTRLKYTYGLPSRVGHFLYVYLVKT